MPTLDRESRLFLGFSRVRGIGFHTLRDLGGVAECAEKIQRGETDPYVKQMVEGAADRDVEQTLLDLAQPLAEKLERAEVGLLKHGDPKFPEAFLELSSEDRPRWIFYRGNLSLLDAPSIAVVGTREPTSTGDFLCKFAISSLVEFQAPVVSGLALGIDSTAHEWALQCQLPTLSVLGTGLLRTYPARNRALADNIVSSNGLLVSEYLPDAGPSRDQFVERNRLQAALASCIVAPEWRKSSGTAHTIRFARRLGRPTINLKAAGVDFAYDHGHADATFEVPREHREFMHFVRGALLRERAAPASQSDLFRGHG